MLQVDKITAVHPEQKTDRFRPWILHKELMQEVPNIIKRIIRLPLKLIAMPGALALFLCHATCAIVIGIGSMVTNLVSGLFIFGATIEWIAGAPSAMAYQCLGLGLFFLAAPHLAGWIVGKAADLLYRVLGFITA